MSTSSYSRIALDGHPFFTALDPDAHIKGSRDPLGFELLWTTLGRKVIGNLTTVTRSVRQFSTLLFGFYFANKATESLTDRDEQLLATFLRFEQLAAYARYTEPRARSDVRGIRAVSRNVQERRGRLCLSQKTDSQILSDQKTYGIYGLFRMAARSSGLLQTEDDTRLTPTAWEHVEQQLQNAKLTPALQKDIVRHIGKDGTIDIDSSPIIKPVAKMLRLKLSDIESQFYGSHLVRGIHLLQPLDTQQQLWECMEAVNSPPGWSQEFALPELRACTKEAQRRKYVELNEKLDRICRAEELLGAAAMLYDFLLTQDKQTVAAVSQRMAECFRGGLKWLDVTDLISAFGPAGEQLGQIADSLRQADFVAACRGLINQNAAVMRERGGSAWIVLKDDRLDVRFLQEGRSLPTLDAIRQPWVHTYFLNAMKRIGGWVYHGQTGSDEDGAE